MASFTDAITQFNPYVSQLPVDAMVKVGMQKQAQYEQGVQKIQSEIDKVAGLDILRNVDKNYLQTKLNELGGKLNTVAAGDFSNFQLVNSVSGMTKQVANDKLVQNAVSSTAWYRKQAQIIDKAKKEGKSSVQNEEWFNNGVSNWLKNPEIGASFSDEYVQYTDVDKKLIDVADKIHEVDSSIDIPYVRDNAGNVIYGKDGKPIIDDAMLRIVTKGKPAEKILAAFYDTLTENDMRQLKIDGWYHYKGATTEKFKNDATLNYNTKKKFLSDELTNLNLELKTNTKLNDSEKNKIQAKINAVNTKLTDGSLDKEYNSEIASINMLDTEDKLNDYKYRLYTQKHLSTLASDLAYQSVQQEYLSNPYAQMAMEKRKLQFQYDDANRKHNEFLMKYQQDESHFWIDYNYKVTKDAKDAAGSTPIVTPDRIPTDVDKPDLVKLESEITAITGNPKKGIVGEIGKLDARYAPLITDPNIKDKKKYLDGLAEAYSRDPAFINNKDVDVNMKEYLRLRRALDIAAAQKQGLYNSTVAASANFDKQINDVFAKDPSIVDKTGKVIFSPSDIYKVANDVSNYKIGAYFSYDLFFKKYQGTKLEPIAKAYYKLGLQNEDVRQSGRLNAPELSTTEKSIVNIGRDLLNKNKSAINDLYKQKLDFQSNYLAERMPERQTATGTLSKDNKVDMDHVDQLLGRKEIEYSQGGLDVNAKKDYDPNEVAKLRENKNVSYSITKKYDGSANLTISSGTSKQVIPLTADEFTAYFPNYAKTNSINDIKYAVLASPYKTTNLVGGKTSASAVNAYLTGESLPQLAGTSIANLVRLDVDGSPFNDGSNKDKFLLRMYVNNNGQWVTRTLTPDYVNEATLDYYLKNIGSTTVSDVLQGK